MKNEKKLNDRDLFQILEGYEEAPSAQAWGKLEKRLGPAQDRKAVVLWRVAAAVTLLMVGGGAFYYGFQGQEGQATVAQAGRPETTDRSPTAQALSQPAAPAASQPESSNAATALAQAEPGQAAQMEDGQGRNGLMLAEVERPKPTTRHLPSSRPRTVDVDKILEGTAKGKRQAEGTHTAQAAQPAMVARQEANKLNPPSLDKEEPASQPEGMVAQAETQPYGGGNGLTESQAATQVAAATPPAQADGLAYTMEIRPTREEAQPVAAADEEDEKPFLLRLVKSANDVAKGRLTKQDLVNKGNMALNSFLHRGQAAENAEKTND